MSDHHRPLTAPVRDRVLIFDADDTLWENNVRFDRTFASFVRWLQSCGIDEAQVRDVFAAVERENAVHGYGTEVFVRSLTDTFERLQARPASAAEAATIRALADDLLSNKVEPMPGTVQTLTDLARRNRLILLTKGALAEQQAKIDVSGLAPFFEQILIVAEKDVTTYQKLIATNGFEPGSTWMIGNSPKSDINPARAAGINAVFIPNANTWALEHAVVEDTDKQILQLRAITDLVKHF